MKQKPGNIEKEKDSVHFETLIFLMWENSHKLTYEAMPPCVSDKKRGISKLSIHMSFRNKNNVIRRGSRKKIEEFSTFLGKRLGQFRTCLVLNYGHFCNIQIWS